MNYPVDPYGPKNGRGDVRQIVRGSEPVESATLDSLSEELKEYRAEQWRISQLQLIAVMIKRLNWRQTKELIRAALGAELDDAGIVKAADRLTEWAETQTKEMP